MRRYPLYRPDRLRPSRAAIVGALLAALGCAGGGRQPLPPPSSPGSVAPPAASDESETPAPPAVAGLAGLLDLSGATVELHYAPGALDRAAHLQLRLEAFAEVLRGLRWAVLPYDVWVLPREEWESARLESPYGIPERVAPAAFAAPAWGDPAMVAEIERLVGRALPAFGATPLRGTAEEAAALTVADRLLQLAVARDFVERAGLAGEEPWITGLLVQLVARLAYERFEPGKMPEIAGSFDAIAAAHGGSRAHRLEDFREGLPLETDLWYHAQLLRGADVVWVEEGARGTSRLLYRLLDKGAPLTRARLERAYPGLDGWRLQSFAP